jgi:hypothetical protein
MLSFTLVIVNTLINKCYRFSDYSIDQQNLQPFEAKALILKSLFVQDEKISTKLGFIA